MTEPRLICESAPPIGQSVPLIGQFGPFTRRFAPLIGAFAPLIDEFAPLIDEFVLLIDDCASSPATSGMPDKWKLKKPQKTIDKRIRRAHLFAK